MVEPDASAPRSNPNRNALPWCGPTHFEAFCCGGVRCRSARLARAYHEDVFMHRDVHREMGDLPSEALLAREPESGVVPRGEASLVAWAEAHASEGCSRCARALVNARDAAVDLASSVPAEPPRPKLRDRVLSNARRSERPVPAPAGRIYDPSATVAHLHIGAAGEPARHAAITALSAPVPREGDGVPHLLEQVRALLGFPLQFVSVIRGERVTYRSELGLPDQFAALRDIRRETSFCTHCVSCDGPLVVEDAAREAFFRGNKLVTRFGVVAYAGVPLRPEVGGQSHSIGTLCVLDFAPRKIASPDIELLERLAERVTAEIELPVSSARRAELLLPTREADPELEVYRHPYFERLARAAAHRASLLSVRGKGDPYAVARVAEPAEIVGIIEGSGDDRIGVIVPGSVDVGSARRAAFARALPWAEVDISPPIERA
jgi:hypothetical protein